MSSIAIRRIHSISGPAISAIALAASVWFLVRTVQVVRAPDAVVASASAEAEMAAVAVATPAPVAEAPAPRRDGAALVARNMFCARCTGVKPPDGGVKSGGGASRFTARLIATSVVSAAYGIATLVDPVTGSGGAFPTGAAAPGGATIVAVRRDAIDVRFADEPVETVWLAPEVGPGPPEPARPEVAATAWGDRVRALGDDHYEVDRRLIGELVGGGTTAAVPGVRLMPVMRDGELAGIKVAAARTGSLARVLGLETGDVIEAIDGQPITSTQMVLELYGKVDQLTRLALTVRRKGAPRTLAYDLR